MAGPIYSSFRALYGRLKLTLRRHEFNRGSLSWQGWTSTNHSCSGVCICNSLGVPPSQLRGDVLLDSDHPSVTLCVDPLNIPTVLPTEGPVYYSLLIHSRDPFVVRCSEPSESELRMAGVDFDETQRLGRLTTCWSESTSSSRWF